MELVKRRQAAGVDRRFHRVDGSVDPGEQGVAVGNRGLIMVTDGLGGGHAVTPSGMAGVASRAAIARSASTCSVTASGARKPAMKV